MLKNLLLNLLTVILVFILILAAVFFFWLGPTVKTLAEKAGSKALGTPVVMESLAINPREGTLLLEGFSVGNHEGYAHSNTVSLTKLAVSINMHTLFSDTIVVQEILIDRPHLVYEQRDASDNIAQFLTNLFAFAKIDPNAPRKTSSKPKPRKEASPRQVSIEHLRITDVKMTLAHSEHSELDLSVGLEELNLSLTNGVIQLKNLKTLRTLI